MPLRSEMVGGAKMGFDAWYEFSLAGGMSLGWWVLPLNLYGCLFSAMVDGLSQIAFMKCEVVE